MSKDMTAKSLTLILMRHAQAADAHRNQKDIVRSLTMAGKFQASTTAEYLEQIGYIPQQVIVSPAIRTQETLAEMNSVWGDKKPQRTDDQMLYDVSHDIAPYKGDFDLVDTFNSVLEQANLQHDCVMVLGHYPSIPNLAHSIASALPQELNIAYPTATAVILELHSEEWNSLAPRHATCKAVIYHDKDKGVRLIRMPDQTPAALLEPEAK